MPLFSSSVTYQRAWRKHKTSPPAHTPSGFPLVAWRSSTIKQKKIMPLTVHVGWTVYDRSLLSVWHFWTPERFESGNGGALIRSGGCVPSKQNYFHITQHLWHRLHPSWQTLTKPSDNFTERFQGFSIPTVVPRLAHQPFTIRPETASRVRAEEATSCVCQRAIFICFKTSPAV